MVNTPKLLSYNTNKLVSSLNCGVYNNWGGGLLLKLFYKNEPPSLIAIQTELVFYLLEDIKRSIKDGNFLDLRNSSKNTKYEDLNNKQPSINQSDFNIVNDSMATIGFSWEVFANSHIEVMFKFQNESYNCYQLVPEMIFQLLDYLESIFKHGYLVDLREFRQLSIEDMEENILTSKGYKLNQQYENYEISKRLLDNNYNELIEHLKQFHGKIENIDFILWPHRHNISIFMEETTRLLHNFTTSCLSLVDHSRVFVNRIEKESKPILGYQNEINIRFINDPISEFIICLRQYVQHYKLPNISTTRQFSSEGFTGKVFLNKDDLLKFSSWKKNAKIFLNEQDEHINFIEILESYYLKVSSFQEWLKKQWLNTFYKELNEAELKRQALMAKISENRVSKINTAIDDYPQTVSKFLELMSDVLTPEELHQLIELENNPVQLADKALRFAEKRCIINDKTKSKILNFFTKR